MSLRRRNRDDAGRRNNTSTHDEVEVSLRISPGGNINETSAVVSSPPGELISVEGSKVPRLRTVEPTVIINGKDVPRSELVSQEEISRLADQVQGRVSPSPRGYSSLREALVSHDAVSPSRSPEPESGGEVSLASSPPQESPKLSRLEEAPRLDEAPAPKPTRREEPARSSRREEIPVSRRTRTEEVPKPSIQEEAPVRDARREETPVSQPTRREEIPKPSIQEEAPRSTRREEEAPTPEEIPRKDHKERLVDVLVPETPSRTDTPSSIRNSFSPAFLTTLNNTLARRSVEPKKQTTPAPLEEVVRPSPPRREPEPVSIREERQAPSPPRREPEPVRETVSIEEEKQAPSPAREPVTQSPPRQPEPDRNPTQTPSPEEELTPAQRRRLVNMTRFGLTNLDKLPEIEKKDRWARLIRRYGVLRDEEGYDNVPMPDPELETLLDATIRYRITMEELQKKSKPNFLLLGLVIVFWAIQFVAVRFLGIAEMNGFARAQMNMLREYKIHMAELGEYDISFGEGMPPWIKLLLIVLVNSIIFFVLKKLSQNQKIPGASVLAEGSISEGIRSSLFKQFFGGSSKGEEEDDFYTDKSEGIMDMFGGSLNNILGGWLTGSKPKQSRRTRQEPDMEEVYE